VESCVNIVVACNSKEDGVQLPPLNGESVLVYFTYFIFRPFDDCVPLSHFTYRLLPVIYISLHI